MTYTTTGTLEEVNDTMIRVTELPIRRWTQEYKEFLEAQMTGNEKIKEPFVMVRSLFSCYIIFFLLLCYIVLW